MARGLPGITYFSVFFGSGIAGDWEKNSLDGDLLARGLPGIGIRNYLTGDRRGLPGIAGDWDWELFDRGLPGIAGDSRKFRKMRPENNFPE